MKLRDAIDVLKKKPQDEEVYFMVFDQEGRIVAMDIEGRDLLRRMAEGEKHE